MMSSRSQQNSIRISFDGLWSFALLWSELVDRTDVDEIVLHIIGNYELSKISLNSAGSHIIALSKLVRSLQAIWQIQLAHLFSLPSSRPAKHKLHLLDPRVATSAVQFLIKSVTDIFSRYGHQIADDVRYSVLTQVYDTLFCALRAIWLSPFEAKCAYLEVICKSLHSEGLSGICNEVSPSQRRNEEDYNESSVLKYLRSACEAILYHLEDRSNDDSKAILQSTRDLSIGNFIESSDPYNDHEILFHLSSLENTASLEEDGSTPPNFRKYCQLYDIYLAAMAICGNHKAKRSRNRVFIEPQVLDFAKTALNKFHCITAKVASNIRMPVLRLATFLSSHLSADRTSDQSDQFDVLHGFYLDFSEDLHKRSNLLTLSDPHYAYFNNELGVVFESMSKPHGSHVPLTRTVDDAVPFAIGNCKYSHIHSQASRRYIDTSSPPNQKRCHVCVYTEAEGNTNITEWREITELTKIHAALSRLKSTIQKMTDERISQMPANRASLVDPIPRLAPPVSFSEAPTHNQDSAQAPVFRSSADFVPDAPGEPSPRITTIQLSPPLHERSRSGSQNVGSLPVTPPRSDGGSPSPSPVRLPANPIEHPHTSPRTSAPSFQFSAVSKISDGLTQWTRKHLTGNKTPHMFAELFSGDSKAIHPICAFSSHGQRALFWSKAYIGAFSTHLPEKQASGNTLLLKFMHKYDGISLDWERPPLIAASRDVFAVTSQNDTSESKINIYSLLSADPAGQIPINGSVLGLSVSPDDSLIAVALKERAIKIFYTRDSQEAMTLSLPTLRRHYSYDRKSAAMPKMSFCGSGQNLVVATRETLSARATGATSPRLEYKVHIWIVSLQTGEVPELWRFFDGPHPLDMGDQGITSVQYNPTLALVCVTFWTTSTAGCPCLMHQSWKQPRKITHKYLESKVHAAAFTPSGSLLVLISADGYVFKVDLRKNYHVTKLKIEIAGVDKDRPSQAVQLRISEDSKNAIILSNDGKNNAKVQVISLS